MYRYLERFGLLVDGSGRPAPNPSLALEVPSIPQKVNDWLRESEDETLLTSEMSDSEAALILTLRWTGLRLSEALSMRISDVDLVENMMYVREGKTARSRRGIPILLELRPVLQQWLTVLRGRGLLIGNGPLFPTRNMKPWTATQAQQIVARVGKRAGLRIDDKGICRLTPHTLRRTFGSSLLNRGVRLEVVSRLLGHASTSVTERAYAELLDQTIRREVYAAFA